MASSQIIYRVHEFHPLSSEEYDETSNDDISNQNRFIIELGAYRGKFSNNGKSVTVLRRPRSEEFCARKSQPASDWIAFERELQALLHFGFHNLVIQLLDYQIDVNNGSFSIYETLGWGGSMTGLLHEINRPLQQEESWFYMVELTEALTYIHSCGILHHDVKEDNIFIQRDGHLLLGDFGLAHSLKLGETMENVWSNQAAHMPFEVHSDSINYPNGRKNYVGHAIDWFSAGVFLYVLLRRELPFRKTLIPSNAPFKLAIPPEFGSDLKSFILGLLCINPFKRLGAKRQDGIEVFCSNWIQNDSRACQFITDNNVDSFREHVTEKRLQPPFILP